GCRERFQHAEQVADLLLSLGVPDAAGDVVHNDDANRLRGLLLQLDQDRGDLRPRATPVQQEPRELDHRLGVEYLLELICRVLQTADIAAHYQVRGDLRPRATPVQQDPRELDHRLGVEYLLELICRVLQTADIAAHVQVRQHLPR